MIAGSQYGNSKTLNGNRDSPKTTDAIHPYSGKNTLTGSNVDNLQEKKPPSAPSTQVERVESIGLEAPQNTETRTNANTSTRIQGPLLTKLSQQLGPLLDHFLSPAPKALMTFRFLIWIELIGSWICCPSSVIAFLGLHYDLEIFRDTELILFEALTVLSFWPAIVAAGLLGTFGWHVKMHKALVLGWAMPVVTAAITLFIAAALPPILANSVFVSQGILSKFNPSFVILVLLALCATIGPVLLSYSGYLAFRASSTRYKS